MNAGLFLDYSNGKLGKSDSISKSDLAAMSDGKRNFDTVPIFIHCAACDAYMDYIPGPKDDLDGKWKCSTCGAIVDERAVYVKIDEDCR